MYCVDANIDEPIMLINKHIGYNEEDGMGIDGSLFQQELLQLDGQGKKRIVIWINSIGGNVLEGYNIFSAIAKTKTPVDTYCYGIAASIAGVIFMAGRKRIMADYASLMMHPPAGSDDKKMMDSFYASLVTAFAANAKISEASVKYLMDRTTWLNSAECLDKGFCTEIDVTSEQNKKRMPSAATASAKAMMNAANTFTPFPTINNYFKNTVMTMTKITMKLGLNDAATEDNVIAAIKGIEDKAYASDVARIKAEKELQALQVSAKADAEALQQKLEELSNKMKSDKEAFDKLKAEYDTMVEDGKTMVNVANKLKAETMVASFVQVGKVKNEAAAISKWVGLAVADFDGTKVLLEELPANHKAKKIEDKVDATVAGAYNVGNMMAVIAARTQQN